MAEKNLNLAKYLANIHNSPNGKLDGLHYSLKNALERLNLTPDLSLASSADPDPYATGSKNMRSVIDWVEELCEPTYRKLPPDHLKDTNRSEYDRRVTEAKRQNAAMKERFKGRCKQLLTLHATVETKFAAAKYTPQYVKTEAEVAAAKKLENRRQNRANKKAAAKAREKEIEKAKG